MDFLSNFINLSYKKNMSMENVTDGFFCLYVYNLLKQKNKNVLIVTNSVNEATFLYNGIKKITDNVLLFPMDDFFSSEALSMSSEFLFDRLDTLNKLKMEKNIIVCNLMGYLRLLPSKNYYYNSFINIKINDCFKKEELIKNLINIGYKRKTVVEETGDFAVRGFILDIFPLYFDNPIRFEFFDDEIESIRIFDADSQRSLNTVDNISITPVTEFVIDFDKYNFSDNNQKYLSKTGSINSLLDYCGFDSFVIYKDENIILNNYNEIRKNILDYNKNNDVDFDGKYIFSFDEIKPNNIINYNYINNKKDDNSIDFNVKNINCFYENIDDINLYLNKKIDDNTIFICLKEYQLNKVAKNLNISYKISNFNNFENNKVNFINFELIEGFEYNNYIFLTAKELFKDVVVKNVYKNKIKHGVKITDINRISVGDYIVHRLYGIGVYNGIKKLINNGVLKDFIELKYDGNDKLYLSVDKIDLLFKYSSKDGAVPKLNNLNGKSWTNVKKKVKNKIFDMADKLIKLYADRNLVKGFAFSGDNYLLKEFEKEVPFNLTDDQIKSIIEIKKDMEKETPMDRLLCGDVGFGKTEVAFVACFKAILDSKQVLFLCPTTILSNQHYLNAIKRFRNFPVNIGLLNRFSTSKEVEKVIFGLRDGSIDIIFGTHRLLSSDIKPKDLGLLVIDEEQRFGVRHKEKIKYIKSNIDVLTLSATPIPRTLQMSLTGMKNFSLIQTPPVNRYPIQTYVMEENEYIIKDAINKELSRNGQVFILYNSVESIEYQKQKISLLVPNAKIGIAHGQLSKKELEDTLNNFINNEFDILLCTTIIETGIDLPNVNTLIIIDADKFGLSQLYQIRGRVGRSDKFAYAYMMYKPYKKLTDTAVKRLNAIKKFTELGSGYSIANHDLAIRGAGDILGSEQAGFIDSVGIELYMQLLKEEMDKRKGIIKKDNLDKFERKEFVFDFSTHISDLIVVEDELKIEIHKMIRGIDSKEKFNLVFNELRDRFGSVDDNLLIYMYNVLFESYCLKLNINTNKINKFNNFVEIVLEKDIYEKIDMQDLFVGSLKISNYLKFSFRNSNFVISLNLVKLEKNYIYYLVDLLELIIELIKER